MNIAIPVICFFVGIVGGMFVASLAASAKISDIMAENHRLRAGKNEKTN